MKNKYVNFITDDHLLECVGNLHNAYLKAKNNITKKNFYSNKVDTIKLTFDSKFNDIDEESLIQAEILRQIDKSINNSIDTFHEQILGGIKSFEVGNLSGFDIKAKDDSLFAILIFELLPKNIEEGLFEKFCNHARLNKKASYYFVDFFSNDDYYKKWVLINEEATVSHKRVFKISANKFYQLLTGNEDAISILQNKLQIVVEDFKTQLI